MIYILLYTLFLFLIFVIIFREHIAFWRRLYLCSHYKPEIFNLYIEKSIYDPTSLIQDIVADTIAFGACLARHGFETEMFFKRLKKTKVYVLQGCSFYYPYGAKDRNGHVHKDLRGLYSSKKNWLIVTEDLSAYRWELKNLWNDSCGDSSLHDPLPSEIGLQNCM